MTNTRNAEPVETKSLFQLVDMTNQPESAKHGDRIDEADIEALFGRDYITELQAILKEGPGEAAYAKGGRFSQIANFPLLRIDTMDKRNLGDIDTKLVGVHTISALRAKHPNREVRNQIAKYKLNDGQEVDFQDSDKVMRETKIAIADALSQIARFPDMLSESQLKVKEHAEHLYKAFGDDPESVLLSNGLNRAKEAAIKVVNVGGKLEYYLCDPVHSLGNSEIFDRERYTSDMLSSLHGKPLLAGRTLSEISTLSIHRLVMEMTTQFGHFDTESPLVMTTLPLVLNIIKSEIEEQMIFAADGLIGRDSQEGPPKRGSQNRALESFQLIKNFLEAVTNEPHFANVKDDLVQNKKRLTNFAEYNTTTIKTKIIEALETDASITLFYIFSYLPSLAKVMFPAIDGLYAIQKYHHSYDKIAQNMLDIYIDFDPDGEASLYLQNNLGQLAFFRNVKQICSEVFPYGYKAPIEGGQTRTSPGVFAQVEPTPSIAKVIAVLLLSAGKVTPSEQLLTQLATDWKSLMTEQVTDRIDVGMDCTVTADNIRDEISLLLKNGVSINN